MKDVLCGRRRLATNDDDDDDHTHDPGHDHDARFSMDEGAAAAMDDKTTTWRRDGIAVGSGTGPTTKDRNRNARELAIAGNL